jgi:hypothetical protein
MAGRILLSALLAAVAIFIWGFIFWVALPFGPSTLKTIPNEDAVRSSLTSSLTESGAYYFPGMDANATDKAAAEKSFRDKALAGPQGLILYKKEGSEPMAPAMMVWGFVHSFIAAVLMGILLVMALPGLPLYGQRVAFVTLGGIFAAYAVDSGFYNWWYFPLGFILANGIYTAIAWLIAGLIMARIIGEMGAAGMSWGESGPRGGGYIFQPPVYAKKR